MTKTRRIAGAQIPIFDTNIAFNKYEIFKALDWAKENEVDLLVTPEGSLSGYGHNWKEPKVSEELQDALQEVENKQKEVGVSLSLGTCFQNYESIGYVNRNQIRHYLKTGELYGITNKTYLVPADAGCVPSTVGQSTPLDSFYITDFEKENGNKFVASGLICNDMWGAAQDVGKDTTPGTALMEIALDRNNIDLIIHSTNGYKFTPQDIDKTQNVRDIFDMWHESWLRMTAYRAMVSIISVDSCTHWNWEGQKDVIGTTRTSSPSGIIDPEGAWLTDVPRTGRQYFYYDLPVNIKDYVNEHKNGRYWEKASDA